MTHPLKILFVDDHGDTRRVVSRLLGLMGHEVVTADSVGNALAVSEQNQFQLLIADIGLPDGTGHALLQGMLQRGPIVGIAVSGYGASEDVEESLIQGFSEHLVKPITVEQLEAAIQRVAPQVLLPDTSDDHGYQPAD